MEAGRPERTMTRSAREMASERSWVTRMAAFFSRRMIWADVVSHVEPGLVVQGGEGFIQEEKVRFQHQGADKGRPLAHAAGELRGAGAGEGLKAINVQKLISLLPGPGGEHVLDLQAQDHVVVDGAPFKQFVVLQHIAYVVVLSL